MIQTAPGVYLVAAFLFLVLPMDWLMAVVAASVFHELMHILVLYILGGKVIKIDVQSGGCVIETDVLEDWRQFVSILAGPVGSFFLLLPCRTAPKTAICGLFQGLYNLIPVLPLDGGRLLRLLLGRICAKHADLVMDCVAITSCIAADLLAIWLSVTVSLGIGPLIGAFLWNIKALPRKIPCKPSRIGLQ